MSEEWKERYDRACANSDEHRQWAAETIASLRTSLSEHQAVLRECVEAGDALVKAFYTASKHDPDTILGNIQKPAFVKARETLTRARSLTTEGRVSEPTAPSVPLTSRPQSG